jgi:hypothetical protein
MMRRHALDLPVQETEQDRITASRRAFLGGLTAFASAAAVHAGTLPLRKLAATVITPDLIPDAWTWSPVSGAPTSSTVTLPTVTPTGFNGTTTFSCPANVQLVVIHGGVPAAAASSGTFAPGDSLTAVVTTPSGNLATVSGNVSIAGGAVLVAVSVTTIPAVGDAAMTIRQTQRSVYDLSTLLSAFNDTGNKIRVSVTNPSGKFAARIWKMRDLVGGDDFSFVKRELLDYFQIIATGASPGDTFAVAFTSYTGPNGTGAQQTHSLAVTCDTAAPTTDVWNPLLKAQFGGWAAHKHLPGNMSDWVLSNDNSGEFDVLRDTTSRTELGSRRTYPTGYLRVVRKATATNPNGMDLNSANSTYGTLAASAPYGGTPKTARADGNTSSFTLTNSVLGQSVTVTVTWSNLAPIHCAPWPAADSLAISGRPTWQFAWYTRLGSTYLKYGATYELQDGDHVYSNAGVWSPGFTTGFGNTTIGGTAPTSLFATGRQHPLNGSMPVYHSNLITIRGESPDVYLKDFAPSSGQIAAASTTAGWHVTGLQARNIVLRLVKDIQAVSHILFHDPTDPLANISLQVGSGSKISSGTVSCWVKGNLNFQSVDAQVVGNLFEAPYTVFDIVNFTGLKENSDDSNPLGLVAFNAWIGCQGLGVAHKDGFQWTDSVSPPGSSASPGTSTSHIWLCNIFYEGGRGGQHLDTTANKYTSPWAEGFFPVPLNRYCNIKWLFFGNVGIMDVSNGFWFHNPTNGTRIRYNMLLKWRAPNQANGSTPYVQMNMYTPTSGDNEMPPVNKHGHWIDGVDDVDIKMEYNISQGGIDFSLINNAGAVGSNLGFDTTFNDASQDATFVNPTIFNAVQDVADICEAYANENGVTCLQNPFSRPDLMDFRRYWADVGALAAA